VGASGLPSLLSLLGLVGFLLVSLVFGVIA
jgi:hypothetical protein